MRESVIHERRKTVRKYLDQPLPIWDRNNDNDLGRVVDISTDGLMVEGQREFLVNHIFQVAITLPAEIQGQATLDLGADCLWCEQASDLKRYWGGFQIIDISPQNRAILDTLIAEY